ncbi:MAG: toxin ParE1/3/4 [Phycisphaerales bacterium]|jgi:plasmid stabilization system protein ParE|nr:toxin ParE1/3/4 [Phycisphaerales bacterium]
MLRKHVPDGLTAIVDYLADKSPDVADRFINAVPATLQELSEMPGKGSPKHFRGKKLAGLRSWNVRGFRNYLILYRTAPEAIEVIAIVHGAQNLSRLLRRRVK